MAEIDLERKKSGGMGWLWGLLILLLLGLLAWWLWPDDDVDDVAVDTEIVEPLPEPVATAPGITIGDILGNPDGFIGETFPRAEVVVDAVPTDRGFWITDEGQRLFVVLIDGPAEQPLDINPGQTLRIDQGMLRDATFIADIPGDPLDQDTENIIREQAVYLVVDESSIEILEGGVPQPGTDPAQSIDTTGGS